MTGSRQKQANLNSLKDKISFFKKNWVHDRSLYLKSCIKDLRRVTYAPDNINTDTNYQVERNCTCKLRSKVSSCLFDSVSNRGRRVTLPVALQGSHHREVSSFVRPENGGKEFPDVKEVFQKASQLPIRPVLTADDRVANLDRIGQEPFHT